MVVRPQGIRVSIALACSVFGLSLASCKTRSSPSELHEIWISLLDTKLKPVQEVSDRNEYIRSFAQLPLEGTIKPAPWTDVSYLDLEGSKSDPKSNLDQDWAAASIFFAEPGPIKVTSATGTKIDFGSSDIKSLLTRFVRKHSRADDGVETRSLGGICHLDSDTLRRTLNSRTLSPESWADLRRDECFRVNPAAFHLALSNLIALRGESFVIDPKVDDTFAYFPIQSFKTEILGTPVEDAEQHQEIQIKTTVNFVRPSSAASPKRQTSSVQAMDFRYKIELDTAGDIVNGTWVDDTMPQMIWVQNRPRFGQGDAELEKLYTMSVSLPARMAIRDYSAIDSEDPQLAVKDNDPLVVNKKYRLELTGDVPRGADGLRNFLKTALRSLGPVSIYRNTFADEDSVMSIDIQIHKPNSFRLVKEAVRSHSNGRAEISRILR